MDTATLLAPIIDGAITAVRTHLIIAALAPLITWGVMVCAALFSSAE